MAGIRRTRAKAKTKTKKHTYSNFQLVLKSIRSTLGLEWTLYEECIEGILRASARQEIISAWCEQMQHLVSQKPEIEMDHAGTLFFLGEMGIKLPRIEGGTAQHLQKKTGTKEKLETIPEEASGEGSEEGSEKA